MKAATVSMAVLVAAGIVSGPGFGQDVAGGSNHRLQLVMDRFHRADVNNDGHLTPDEAQKGMPRVYEHFAEIDTDHKGYVTLDQITAYLATHRPPRGERGGPPPGSAPPSQ